MFLETLALLELEQKQLSFTQQYEHALNCTYYHLIITFVQ